MNSETKEWLDCVENAVLKLDSKSIIMTVLHDSLPNFHITCYVSVTLARMIIHGTQQYLFQPEAGEWGRKLLEPGIVLQIWRCCNNLPVATYMFLLCLLEFEFIGPFFQ